MSELRDLTSRLAPVYSSSRRLEEIRYPGLARQAELMVRDNPERYGAIASSLMDGEPVDEIARANKVRPQFVRFVRQMHPELVQVSRAQLINHLEEASIAMARRLIDEVRDLNLDRISGTLSITLDKLSLLTGGVTARTEHVSAPKAEDVVKMFEALPKAMP